MKNQNLPLQKNALGVKSEQTRITLPKLAKISLSELNLCELDNVVGGGPGSIGCPTCGTDGQRLYQRGSGGLMIEIPDWIPLQL